MSRSVDAIVAMEDATGPEQALRARLFLVVALALVGALSISCLYYAWVRDWNTALILITGDLLAASAVLLSRAGHDQSARVLLSLTVLATLTALMLFGNGIAPVLANHVYDVTKSYDSVLWFQIPACLGTAVLFLLLGPYPAFPTEQEAPAATA